MPFKRKFVPRFGARKRARTIPYRRKVGYRKYIRKASTYSRARPARFRFSRRAYRFNTAVARTIRGMAETKVIPLREQNWAQPSLTPTAPGVTAVKFITGSTPLGQYAGYTPVGGFAAPQGDGKNNRDGQFIFLKHTTAALTIQMDHLSDPTSRPAAIRFRVIVFKGKRALDPSGLTISPDTNLFLQNDGNNFGDASTAVNAMNIMDMQLQPLNTNSFQPLMDRQFTLQHTSEINPATAGNNAVAQTNFPSTKTIRLRFDHNTKARIPLNSTDEPVDYNYRFAVAIYAFWPNQNYATTGDDPLTWSASMRGTTGFNDV